MNFIEQLEEEPLSELIRYKSGSPQNAVAFSEDRLQLHGEPGGVRILNFIRVARTLHRTITRQLLPCEEKIGQFRVVDIVEKGWIGDHQIDAAI